MYNFVQHIVVAINLVFVLALPVLLVLLCIRTHSKGLIIITAVIIFRLTDDLIPPIVTKSFLDQWSRGKLNNWLTQHMTVGQFIVLCHYVVSLPYNGLLALGTFLIYREWSCGKLLERQHKSPEIVNHA